MATNTVSYFPLSQLHQEIDDTLTGAVRFNAEQELTETQKAQARENIGAVPFGSNLKILGHFNTVAELQASAPQNVGDAYSVGAATPYNLYIFDGLRNEWLNYGQIRAADISSRYVENQVIAVSAWTADTSTIAGFNYKAQITISGATGDDFPIVAFNQSDAVSGNFAALAFSNNGHIEIFAKTKPTAAVTIPIATLIVNGGNGRGITNATGGIATGSIKTADLADGSVTAAKIKDGEIVQSKLSVSARCGLVISATAGKNLENSDAGNTYYAGWTSTGSVKTWTLNAELSAAISNGFAVAFTELWPSDKTRISISGVRLLHRGEGTLLGKSQSAVLGLVERCNMIALQKMSTDATNGDVWLITGDVEVVS